MSVLSSCVQRGSRFSRHLARYSIYNCIAADAICLALMILYVSWQNVRAKISLLQWTIWQYAKNECIYVEWPKAIQFNHVEKVMQWTDCYFILRLREKQSEWMLSNFNQTINCRKKEICATKVCCEFVLDEQPDTSQLMTSRNYCEWSVCFMLFSHPTAWTMISDLIVPNNTIVVCVEIGQTNIVKSSSMGQIVNFSEYNNN